MQCKSIDGVQISQREKTLLREMTLGISGMLPISIYSGCMMSFFYLPPIINSPLAPPVMWLFIKIL